MINEVIEHFNSTFMISYIIKQLFTRREWEDRVDEYGAGLNAKEG